MTRIAVVGLTISILSSGLAIGETRDEASFLTESNVITWTASEGTPPLGLARTNDQRNGQLQVRAPFASDPKLRRAVLDRLLDATNESDAKLQHRIAQADEFEVLVHAVEPSAFGHVTLYFQSGDGWHACAGSLSEPKWNTLTFRRAEFTKEGLPGDWSDIRRIRLAFWRAKPTDATLVLRDFDTVSHRIVLLAPKDDGGSESRSALSTTAFVRDLLAESGIGTKTLTPEDIDRLSAEQHDLLIVPYLPRWDTATTDAVADYVGEGGKLMAFYRCPDKVLAALGFGNPQYMKPDRGTLQRVHFDGSLANMPNEMRQASWNITVVDPASDDARIIGWWSDEGGAKLYPACALSDRGVFFSHILLSDDRENKRAFLEAICGQLSPGLWREMVSTERKRMGEIGSPLASGDVSAFISEYFDALPRAEQEAILADIVPEPDFKTLKASDYPAAIGQYRAAQASYRKLYLMATPSRANEGRAWWNHSGTGPYPGDWGRAMKELSDNGFNMVLPNMLWGGLAHYPSDLLPRSRTFEQYGDQMAQCVEAGKTYGVEVHVWKVNWNMSNAPRAFVEQMRREGRTQVTFTGEDEDWLCPSHPANVELEAASMLEVAKRYDVDGLHFDYIRYPGSDNCFCDGCRKRFEKHIGEKVANWPADCRNGPLKEAWTQWRCDRITELVRRVSTEAKRIRPDIKISAAVFGSYPDCRSSVAQDWPVWVERGYLDFLCPMDYTESDHAFKGLVENQLQLVGGRIPVYPGIGVTASRSRLTADRVAGQIEIARQAGADGFTLFNLSESTAQGISPGLALGATRERATPPHGD